MSAGTMTRRRGRRTLATEPTAGSGLRIERVQTYLLSIPPRQATISDA